MEKEKISKKTMVQAVALVSVLTLAFTGLWILVESIKEGQEVDALDEPINVNFRIIKEKEWSMEYIGFETLNNTVFKLLIEFKERDNFSVTYTYWKGYDAFFVDSINDTQNGENGMWWQFYVNGIYGEIASDKKEIFEGDLVEWRFEEPGQ